MNNDEPAVKSNARLASYSSDLRRRRARLDAQMVILISINVAPFILVHIVTEIAYLLETYSKLVNRSIIVLIYISYYLVSATRFYTNCLLSRIYRDEFKNRLVLPRRRRKARMILVDKVQSHRNRLKYQSNGMMGQVDDSFAPAARSEIVD